MKKPALLGRLAFAASAPLLISACANLNSIERRSYLPADGKDEAIAVHLDAKQRVLVSHSSGVYCAEPNPDALSAASSGQGASASVPGTGAGALSLAAQESAASIGLRTQSIQLQREIFYRLCEAYYNGGLSSVQLATLLGRNQDLTAVVLAVEQLTGAVTANQVILTGSAGATSTASLVSNQKALEAARAAETQAKERLDEAEKGEAEKKEALVLADAELKEAEKALEDGEAADPAPKPSELEELRTAVTVKTAARDAAKGEAEKASALAKQARLNHEDTTKVRSTIEATLESAMASAAANATGSGQFAVPAPRNELSKEATEAIADSVEAMVTAVLNKNDIIPTCLGVLALSAEEEQALDLIRRLSGETPSRSEERRIANAAQTLSNQERQSARDKAREVCFKLIEREIARTDTPAEG